MAALNVPLFPESGSEAIREWWQSILRKEGAYPSYVFFLVLKSDKNVTNYLSEYGAELDFISGKDCLILAFNKNKFRRSGVDKKMRSVETLRSADGRRINTAYWKMLVKDLISEGYSIQIANHFQIPFDKFPCLVVFQDINSSEHIIISLSDMDVNEVAKRMKTIFSTIHNAVTENKPVLSELEKLRTMEAFKKGSQVLVSSIYSLVGKSVNTAMETWIKASLSSHAN